MEEIEVDEGDICNILLATDIHLGFAEKDPIRGGDSFIAFEEILEIGQRNEVDFILLGGDLFHDAKPSPLCLQRCLSLLRKYCLGDRPIQIEFLSDQAKIFGHCDVPVVNYEDPNFNVSMPVFSIHGNHDDPSGNAMICSLDILSTSGVINYFGRWLDLTKVEITPMVLRKGSTLVAIYGLSHIKDARLSRLFADNKVTMERPSEKEELFNILVLHQNRAERGPKNHLPEEALPDFLDLVMWGHEHECRIEPEDSPRGNFRVTQPGSPVATSLCEGESVPKKVGILQIYKKKYKLEVIPLKTVRPFIFDSLHLSEEGLDLHTESLSQQVEILAEERVNKMIEDAKKLLSGNPKQPDLPLIRLRIFYSNEQEMFNQVRFGQKFEDSVANASEIILFRKERVEAKETKEVVDKKIMQGILKPSGPWDVRVERYVEKYFQETENSDSLMKVLSAAGLNEAVTRFIDKQDKDAIEEIARLQTSKMIDYLIEQNVDEDSIIYEMENCRRDRTARDAEEAKSHLEGPNRTLCQNRKTALDDDIDIEEVEEDNPVHTNGAHIVDDPPAPTGRGGGRGSRGQRGSRGATATTGRGGRGKGGTQQTLDSFSSLSPSTTRAASSRATPTRATSSRATSSRATSSRATSSRAASSRSTSSRAASSRGTANRSKIQYDD